MRRRIRKGALDIWDSFSSEERAGYPTWGVDRYAAAAAAAVADHYHVHDLSSLEAVIQGTPDAQRPKLQLNTAAMIFARNDAPHGLWMLSQARRTLENLDVDDVSVYLMLLTTYASVMPSEVPSVLKLAVAGINRVPLPKPDSRLWVLPMGYDLQPYRFGPSMSDLDASLVSASIQALESPVQRVCFRLDLLQAALDRYQARTSRPAQLSRVAQVKTRH